MSDLVVFVTARLDEDAVRATMRTIHAEDCESVPAIGSDYTYPCECGVPERLLREVDAKRKILADYERMFAACKAHPDDLAVKGALLALHGAVKTLAAVDAGHPDYDPAWAS
jgi:Family of unknown function (DUF6221)